jgi:hypothetical protein
MKCRAMKLPGGGTAIVCGPRVKSRPCHFCKRPSTKLCDAPDPFRESGTCDAPLCDACAVKVGPNRDYCPNHPRDDAGAPAQGSLL